MTDHGRELRESMARVEQLTQALESCSDATAREAARELLQTLLALHAAGLQRVLELVEGNTVASFAADPLVSSVLLLHAIHPLSAEQRVRAAIERAQSRFHGLGATVELLHADEEIVRVRLGGDAEHGATLRAEIEELVIAAVPDVVTIEIEEARKSQSVGRTPLPVLRGGGRE